MRLAPMRFVPMRLLRRGALLAWGGLLLAVPTLAAQEHGGGLREISPNERRGFWIGFGLGAGVESYDVAGDGAGYTDDLTRPTFYLKLGGTPSQSVLLGAELFAWGHDDGGVEETLSQALFIVQWYPARRGAFFLKGGLGIADNRFDDGVATVSNTGVGLVAGAGYDIRVGRSVSIVPTIDLVGQGYDDYRERILNFGLGVVFH
ncbi:MAG TPA: hypothetical protein VNK43_06385 [Gemmatimonadales bacterium]|nr:hypothetical protein [Gemmatimonadales bacterium]